MRKFDKYCQKNHQYIVDILVGGNKSPIFPINQLSRQKIFNISVIYHRFLGNISKKTKTHFLRYKQNIKRIF